MHGRYAGHDTKVEKFSFSADGSSLTTLTRFDIYVPYTVDKEQT